MNIILKAPSIGAFLWCWVNIYCRFNNCISSLFVFELRFWVNFQCCKSLIYNELKTSFTFCIIFRDLKVNYYINPYKLAGIKQKNHRYPMVFWCCEMRSGILFFSIISFCTMQRLFPPQLYLLGPHDAKSNTAKPIVKSCFFFIAIFFPI